MPRIVMMECMDFETKDFLFFLEKMRILRKLGGYGELKATFHDSEVVQWEVLIKDRPKANNRGVA